MVISASQGREIGNFEGRVMTLKMVISAGLAEKVLSELRLKEVREQDLEMLGKAVQRSIQREPL